MQAAQRCGDAGAAQEERSLLHVRGNLGSVEPGTQHLRSQYLNFCTVLLKQVLWY
jgi:hypothetical protein